MYDDWSWITSQFDTAPKLNPPRAVPLERWITSQFDTAPKRGDRWMKEREVGLPVSSTLLQNSP